MGRRCACDRLLETMRTDPRMRVIPVAARYLWLALADALARLPDPGVFLLGSRVGSVLDICMMLSMDKSDVETCIDILLETQMITRRDDGVLVIPDIIGLPGRASVSAANGRKSGGRPRKGEDLRQYRLRVFGTVEGGLAETQETQQKPDMDNLPRARTAAAADSLEQASKQPRDDVSELGHQLAEIAGLDTIRGTFNFRPVATWLQQGVPPELLIEVFSAVAARPGYAPPRSLGYFAEPVAEAFTRGVALGMAKRKPASGGQQSDASAYVRAVDAYVAGGMVGPAPVRSAAQVAA